MPCLCAAFLDPMVKASPLFALVLIAACDTPDHALSALPAQPAPEAPLSRTESIANDTFPAPSAATPAEAEPASLPLAEPEPSGSGKHRRSFQLALSPESHGLAGVLDTHEDDG